MLPIVVLLEDARWYKIEETLHVDISFELKQVSIPIDTQTRLSRLASSRNSSPGNGFGLQMWSLPAPISWELGAARGCTQRCSPQNSWGSFGDVDRGSIVQSGGLKKT